MKIRTLAIMAPIALLAACSDSNKASGPIENGVVVAARASDYSSGALSLLSFEAPFTATNGVNATISDIAVRADGDHYFLIERFDSNRISRHLASDPETPVYQYSTQSDEEGGNSNPYDILVASPTKAYVLRYGSPILWIVNPSAATEAEFKVGEIDLSHYDADGTPEMAAGLIQDGLLYIAMQRLEFFSPVQSGYLAIIDTLTDEEIDTETGDLPGVELPVRNPVQIVADPSSDDLLIVGNGGSNYSDSGFIPVYEGGLVRFNPGTYDVTLQLDDGETGNAPFGQFTALALVDGSRGYFIGSTLNGFGSSETLFRFNPSGTDAPQAVTGFTDTALSDIRADSQGRLWVGLSSITAPGIAVLQADDNSEQVLNEHIDTLLVPLNIDFLTTN